MLGFYKNGVDWTDEEHPIMHGPITGWRVWVFRSYYIEMYVEPQMCSIDAYAMHVFY